MVCHSFFLRYICNVSFERVDWVSRFFLLSASSYLCVLAVLIKIRFVVNVVSLVEGFAFGTALLSLVCCFPISGWLIAVAGIPNLIVLVPKFLLWCNCLHLQPAGIFKWFITTLVVFLLALIFNCYFLTFMINY